MRRIGVILAVIALLWVALRASAQLGPMFQSAAGVPPNATPAPTPTPPPGVNLSPSSFPGTYANLQAAINGNPAGTTFDLACGTYRFPATGDSALNPLAGDVFIGQNADLTYPTAALTAVPSAEPCAILNGAYVVPSWTHITVSGQDLWYNTVGLGSTINSTANIIGSCNTVVGSNNSGSLNASYAMWAASTSYALGTFITDSNGNLQKVTTAGTSAATPPSWATTVGSTTSDGSAVWTVSATTASPTAVMGACSYPQNLYANSVLVNRVLTWPPSAGMNQWYFDVSGNQGNGGGTVYLPDNPASKTIELTVTAQAFNTTANNLTIENLGIEKFATQNQRGTVETDGQNDLINANWLTHNHGECVKPRGGANTTISYNEVVECGESGINSGGGSGYIVTHNTIERNNEDGVGYGFESGGTKFAADFADSINNNIIRYNNNVGLWEDSNGGSSAQPNTWSSNTVTGNAKDGIRYEISNYGVIEDNVTLNNGQASNSLCVAAHVPALLLGTDCCTGPQTGTCGSACATGGYYEIVSAQSNHMTIGASGHRNTTTSNCSGIDLTAGTRSASPTSNVQIQYNTVTVHSGSNAATFLLGAASYGSGAQFDGTSGYDHNTYHFDNATSLAKKNWQWNNGAGGVTTYTFAQWQAQGQDINGSAVTP